MKDLILVADDSATIQRLVAQTFADSDVKIVAVSNGDAAIRKFDEIRPQLVLTDIYMPGKNGYEVCAYIKRHAELAETPVVLLAGAFDAFDEATALRAGASAHITKPFEPQALVDLVMGLLATEPGTAAAAAASVPASALTSSAAPSAPAPSSPASRDDELPDAALSIPPVQELDLSEDLLGLGDLFQPAAPEAVSLSASDEDIERIADRVIQKISTQVIESVAWDVVPDITEKFVREELKRQS